MIAALPSARSFPRTGDKDHREQQRHQRSKRRRVEGGGSGSDEEAGGDEEDEELECTGGANWVVGQ